MKRVALVAFVVSALLTQVGCGDEKNTPSEEKDLAGLLDWTADLGPDDIRSDTKADLVDTLDQVTPPDLHETVVPDVVETVTPVDVVPPDLPPPPDDADDDGIPDEGDLFPNDPTKPGMASMGKVYAHTSSELFTMDVKDYYITKVGPFTWDSFGGGEMTDIAIDRFGVLYGVTFDTLYTCHPATAACTELGDLPDQFNGLTMVPKGVLDPDKDVLIGIANSGDWYRLTVVGGTVQKTLLGSYGGGYSSSGDAYSIKNVGTFASVNSGLGMGDDVLVALNPANGKVTNAVGPITGYSEVFGLAGWTGKAFAFDSSGTVLVIDTATGDVSVAVETEYSWWGAGVRTEIF